MSMIRRIFVEKKDAFAVEAHGLLADLRNNLGSVTCGCMTLGRSLPQKTSFCDSQGF